MAQGYLTTYLKKFTFQHVSINSYPAASSLDSTYSFTFQHVSINSAFGF
ncbi:hypothetical protein BACPEC_01863 [[Bacteroides] pectinophilus ATCC 43243]|uniref:Uncharacterized protein n=1 Tax=[Bacteroides] pectinophilus ATCC 43243 TaxID=483218 RepID=B7AS09_9FIRM|nr:hypothetical protein BACPEC_01863 [[Bacteroides] pectinophilus ATCC 43243]